MMSALKITAESTADRAEQPADGGRNQAHQERDEHRHARRGASLAGGRVLREGHERHGSERHADEEQVEHVLTASRGGLLDGRKQPSSCRIRIP
jgi:hypothetical protein